MWELVYLWIKTKNHITMTEAVKKNGINFGILSAVYFVVRTSIIYAADLTLFSNLWVTLLDLVIGLTLAIMAISKAKKALGGFITFKEAFTVYFLNTIISFAVYTVFIILLFNVIDPEAKEIVHNYNIEQTVGNMQKFGMETEAIRETVDKMRENNALSVNNQLLGFPIGVAISCIIGLIIAAIMKKNKPEFE